MKNLKPLIFLLSVLFLFLTAEARPHHNKDCESSEEGLWIESEEGLQWVDTSVCEKKKKKKVLITPQEQLNSYFAKSAINPSALDTAEEEAEVDSEEENEEEATSSTTEIGAEAVSVSPELQRQCDEYSQMATQEAVLQGVSPSTIPVPEICQQAMAVNPLQEFMDEESRQEEDQNNMQNMAPLAAALPGMMGGGDQGGGGSGDPSSAGGSGGDYSSAPSSGGDYANNDTGPGSSYDGGDGGEDTFGSTNQSASSSDVECMARTIQGEAGHESQQGMEMVAKTINARVASKTFPDTICGVVKQGGDKKATQFNGYWDSLRKGQSISPQVRAVAQKYSKNGQYGPYLYFKSAGTIGVEDCAASSTRVGGHTFYSACNSQENFRKMANAR